LQQVQEFINAKVPVCDTWGNQPYGGTTRGAYGTSVGNPPPYTCLKDFRQDTAPKASETGLCNGYGAANQSAAEIIHGVAQSCGINPKVLIVLLQKEQSLITDDWPWPIQYRSATGYGCPDTAPCDAEYYGFFNQVYHAGRQFKRYARDANLFNFKAGQTSFIQYNPNAGCGGTNINIQNQATAGLYNYTPYQPNAAALSNLYGTGDGCSAYGNRNFWRMFNDWFGSTMMEVPYAWAFESAEAFIDSGRTMKFTDKVSVAPSGKVYMTVKARNIGNQTWTPSYLRLGTSGPRDRTSIFADPSWPFTTRPAALLEGSIGPGQTGTLQFTLNAPVTTGNYREIFNVVADGHAWLNEQGLYFDIDVVNPVSASNSSNINLPSGQVLRPGQSLLSPDRHTVLILQKDGNLVQYSNFQPVWHTGTRGFPVDRLEMQVDGNLVLYEQSGTPIWHTNTYGNNGASLHTQTDGNLVLYTTGFAPLWATNAVHRPDHLSHVNSSMTNTALFQGQLLETADRKYRLVLQEDGNLVIYSNSTPIWHTGTHGRPKPFLVMQPDGNLVLYDENGVPLWHPGTNGRGVSRLDMQADGNLVIYDGLGRPTWQSFTRGL
jgi:hypothetical protein